MARGSYKYKKTYAKRLGFGRSGRTRRHARVAEPSMFKSDDNRQMYGYQLTRNIGRHIGEKNKNIKKTLKNMGAKPGQIAKLFGATKRTRKTIAGLNAAVVQATRAQLNAERAIAESAMEMNGITRRQSSRLASVAAAREEAAAREAAARAAQEEAARQEREAAAARREEARAAAAQRKEAARQAAEAAKQEREALDNELAGLFGAMGI
jgi:chromosome segregation ATPase